MQGKKKDPLLLHALGSQVLIGSRHHVWKHNSRFARVRKDVFPWWCLCLGQKDPRRICDPLTEIHYQIDLHLAPHNLMLFAQRGRSRKARQFYEGISHGGTNNTTTTTQFPGFLTPTQSQGQKTSSLRMARLIVRAFRMSIR